MFDDADLSKKLVEKQVPAFRPVNFSNERYYWHTILFDS